MTERPAANDMPNIGAALGPVLGRVVLGIGAGVFLLVTGFEIVLAHMAGYLILALGRLLYRLRCVRANPALLRGVDQPGRQLCTGPSTLGSRKNGALHRTRRPDGR